MFGGGGGGRLTGVRTVVGTEANFTTGAANEIFAPHFPTRPNYWVIKYFSVLLGMSVRTIVERRRGQRQNFSV